MAQPSPLAPYAAQYEREAASSRRILERVPSDRFDWRPHPRSTAMGALANHIVQLLGLPARVLRTEAVDMAAAGARPVPATSTADLLATLDRSAADVRQAIAEATPESVAQTWTLRRGDTVIFTMPRPAVLAVQLSHLIHHRGQLSVYLRLNDVPVPGMYGPSADDA